MKLRGGSALHIAIGVGWLALAAWSFARDRALLAGVLVVLGLFWLTVPALSHRSTR